MKTLRPLIIILVIASSGFAQTVNWRSLQGEDKHILNVNAGWDHAAEVGIAYGYKLKFQIPLIMGTELSIPTGETLIDDFKVKIGAQAEVFRHNHFSTSLKIQGIFRRYESGFVTLQNFGSEFSTTLGYYKPRWYAAAELGFDKAIVTHIRHSPIMEEYYPDIHNGWFIPTGGNFKYGIQVGYSLRKYDVYLKTGKTVTQDFKTKPSIPFYLQVGLNRKF